VDAVVMAAGEGRRLRPLTERWPKPILPVDGRPVVTTLLRELAAAGFGSAWVVTGHLADAVEALVGDGRAFGVVVRYVRQPEAVGSADAVRRALAAGARAPLLVTAADTVYTPGDVARARAAWEGAGTVAGIAVRPLAGRELRHQTRVRMEDGRIVAFGDAGAAAGEGPGPTLTGAPLWFLGERPAAWVADVPGPPFELASVLARALDAGEAVSALPVGPTRDLTRPEDVVVRNFPYLWRSEGRDG
jgi:MurNAc alpha-1-phosphate uridylyltransferase